MASVVSRQEESVAPNLVGGKRIRNFRFIVFFIKQAFEVLVKCLLGWAIIFAVVGPMAFGTYKVQSFVVGLSTGLAVFLGSILTTWIQSPGLSGLGILGKIFQLDKLNEVIDDNFWNTTIGSLTSGLAIGFGVGLGVSLAEGLNEGSIAKGFTIGLIVSLLAGFLIPIALDPDRNARMKTLSEMYAQGRYHFALAISAPPVLFLVLSLGLSEAFGGGLLAATLTGVLVCAYIVLISLISMGFTQYSGRTLPLGWTRLKAITVSLIVGLMWALGWGSFVYLYTGSGTGLLGGIAVTLGAGVGASIGICSGGLLAVTLSRGMRNISGLSRYLQEMRWPVLAFGLAYFAIILLFAGFYSSIYHLQQLSDAGQNAFTHAHPGEELPGDSFWDFTYFSLMTITSLGYSDLQANSPLIKTIVSSEVVMGIAWTVVVFAAVVAYLEPRFTKIGMEERNKLVARQLVEKIFDQDDVAVEEILASGHTFYDPIHRKGTDDLGHIATLAAQLHYGLHEPKTGFGIQVTKGNYVVTHWTVSGNEILHNHNDGEQSFIGKQREVLGIQLIRIADGKISKVWSKWEHPVWLLY